MKGLNLMISKSFREDGIHLINIFQGERERQKQSSHLVDPNSRLGMKTTLNVQIRYYTPAYGVHRARMADSIIILRPTRRATSKVDGVYSTMW